MTMSSAHCLTATKPTHKRPNNSDSSYPRSEPSLYGEKPTVAGTPGGGNSGPRPRGYDEVARTPDDVGQFSNCSTASPTYISIDIDGGLPTRSSVGPLEPAVFETHHS
jgi:hypothetical protein